MGKNTRLEINVGVKEPVVANDLELEGAGEGHGEGEGGGASGNDGGIDHIIVLVNQLQHTAVAGRLERQHITVNIYGRREHGGFVIGVARLCRINFPCLKGDRVAWRIACVHECGHREDAEKDEKLFHCVELVFEGLTPQN